MHKNRCPPGAEPQTHLRGNSPTVTPIISLTVFSGMLEGVKTMRKRQLMTLGGPIGNFNNACGERWARGLLQLAARARLLVLGGHSRNLSRRGKAKA